MWGAIKFCTYVVMLTALSGPAWGLDNPASFTFDGNLQDNAGNPVVGGSHTILFQIYDPAGACLLFEETHSGVSPDASGGFSLKVGTGTRAPANDGGVQWKTIFSNKAQVRSAGTNCGSGYTPATNDGRALKVTVDGTPLTPNFSISSVPFATVADSVQGYEPIDFLKSVGGSLTGFLKMDSANDIRFADSGNTNYVSLRAPASVTTTNYYLPTADGAAGYVLSTNGAGQMSWVAQSGGSSLSLSGGTMTGAINMGGQDILAGGNIIISPQKGLNLGTYTSAQESTLVPSLTAANKGLMWFNSTTNQMMYYDGTSAIAVSNAGSPVALTSIAQGGATNGNVLTWNGSNWTPMPPGASGITALGGDLTAVGPGFAAATIQSNAVTSSKINNVGIASNRLLITDNVSGTSVTYATCGTDGYVLKWTAATGWGCAADDDSVTSVAGRTGAVTLSAADIAGLGTAASLTYGTAAGDLVQLDGIGKIPSSTLPTNVFTNGGNSFGATALIGTQDSNGLQFITNNMINMTLDTAGNLGIGTPFPTTPLHVLGLSDPFPLKVDTFSTQSGIQISRSGYNTKIYSENVAGSHAFLFDIGDDAIPEMTIQNYAAGVGKVGINTTNPWGILTAVSDGTSPTIAAETYSPTSTTAPTIELHRARGSPAAPADVMTGDNLGAFAFHGFAAGFSSLPGARIRAAASENWTGSAHGTDVVIETAPNGSGVLAPRVVVTNVGNVGIGTSAPTAGLDVQNGFAVGNMIAAGQPVQAMRICTASALSGSITTNMGTLSVSCGGAPIGAVANCSPDSNLGGTPMTWNSFVTTAGTVTIRFMSTTASGSIPSANWRCLVAF